MHEHSPQPPPLPPQRRPRGIFQTALLGALILGGIGFVGGFFGPIIFTPEANQGPLLGIFITGPAGVIVGAVRSK